jgi:DNA-directed RNA polymerase specialized sigma24 family protein
MQQRFTLLFFHTFFLRRFGAAARFFRDSLKKYRSPTWFLSNPAGRAEDRRVDPAATALRDWLERYQREACGRGVVFALLARWGTHPDVAADRAAEALQEAGARVLGAYGTQPERFRDFAHFANTVTRIAVNWLRDRRRQTRGIAGAFDDDLPARPASDPRTDLIVRALGRLGTDDQSIITEAVINGLSLDALAERFLEPDYRSANARRLCVRRRLREALDRLRATFDEIDTE